MMPLFKNVFDVKGKIERTRFVYLILSEIRDTNLILHGCIINYTIFFSVEYELLFLQKLMNSENIRVYDFAWVLSTYIMPLSLSYLVDMCT